jgi:uncharacterized membrane protein YdjX (TVP38/TMEM64 family)
VAAVVVAIGIALFAAHHFRWLDPARLRSIAAAMRRGPPRIWVAAVFVFAYVAIVVFALPATPANLVGGAIFGFWLGLLVNYGSLMLGSALSYVIAQSAARKSVERILVRGKKRRALMQELKTKEGLLAMLGMHLVPMMPPALLNYAAGVARVGFGRYMLSAAIGNLVPTAVFTYFADRLLARAGGAKGAEGKGIFIAAGLMVLVAVAPLAWRWWKRRRG